MSNSDGTLSCSINLEWKNTQGTITRKITHKSVLLRLIRNDLRDIFIELSSEKAAKVKLQIKNINVHKKFMAEGKASIIFQDVNCTMYISNAPPGNLLAFLKLIFVKMTGDTTKSKLNTSLRTQLLSHNPSASEEISPATGAELEKAHKLASRTTDTTPSPSSRKRKLEQKENKREGPAAKRLYSSPLPEQLNIEQQQVLDACLSGANVFFTGSAGTGKSYLLRKIIAALPPDVTVATASTGVAACHIGGVTIHAFAGIGNGDASLERSCMLASKPQTSSLWRKCKHLIIDEISMLDGLFFEKIEAVARHVRKSEKPFGGIQLIMCGDFLQLPPVIKSSDIIDKTTGKERIKFCFQSPAWDKCINISYELKIVHRQTDSKFINILNNVRIGRITTEITEELTKTAKQKIEQDGILATRLCSHTNEADTINKHKLDKIEAEEKIFNAEDSNKVYTNTLDQQTPAPNKLVLKIGAQVMLLRNINVSAGLVNGARGVVTDFKNDLPVVKFRNNRIYTTKREKWVVKTLNGGLIARSQIPLKLAWAFSIHKSQGLTLDCVEMSLSRVFEAGQAYVALSRAQSLETLRVLDFNSKQVWANPDVLKFYKKLRIRMEQTEIIPLGQKKSNLKRTLSKSKINILKSNKPLMSIC